VIAEVVDGVSTHDTDVGTVAFDGTLFLTIPFPLPLSSVVFLAIVVYKVAVPVVLLVIKINILLVAEVGVIVALSEPTFTKVVEVVVVSVAPLVALTTCNKVPVGKDDLDIFPLNVLSLVPSKTIGII
jgi:hypothetical protein